MLLQDTLRVREPDNVVLNWELIEIFRGTGEIDKYLHRLKQVVYHSFPMGKISGNHWHKTKYEIMFV